jgi:gluconate 2-dehydrogenase gamma chain
VNDTDLARRELLRRLTCLLGACALPLPFSACPGPRSASARQARTLDPHEWAVIEAATGRIIPTDDLPGAREANVVGFIDAELAAPSFAIFRRELGAGVRALDAVAKARFESPFVDATPAAQDEVLSALQSGEGSRDGFRSAHFFQVLFTFTIEGLFSDPAHGGNAGEVGWRILGFVPGVPRPGGGHA